MGKDGFGVVTRPLSVRSFPRVYGSSNAEVCATRVGAGGRENGGGKKEGRKEGRVGGQTEGRKGSEGKLKVPWSSQL